MAKSGKTSLKKILKEYSKDVQEAAVNQLNKEAEMLVSDIDADMDRAGIKTNTGALKASVKAIAATVKNLDAGVISEVYAPMPTKPGSRNENIYYPKKGVPYGRLIEFSPRINRPFFYTSFYEKRGKIIDRVFDACKQAGKK